MTFTRSKKKQVNRRSEYKPDEADSTVAGWPSAAPPKRRRNVAPWEQNNGVDWQDGLPEGPLLRMFEQLLAENTKEARETMHNAAATCTQWREAFYEVTLGDTAASRPARPPITRDEVQEKKPPATTATTCAAVCEPSKSETNGFEACSGRRLPTAGDATAPGRLDRRRSNHRNNAAAPVPGQAAAAAAAAAAPAVADAFAAAEEPAVQQGDQQQQQQQQALLQELSVLYY
ncbi:hypothetical protein OEZ86_013805 [Tetradesmus obliquus]|nr:hypothetical protein OEZ86_013805 [Tetradesmus obliquus]